MQLYDIITEFANASLYLYIVYFFFTSFWEKKFGTLSSMFSFLAIDILFACTRFLFKGSIIVYFSFVLFSFLISFLFKNKLKYRILCTAIILAIMGAAQGIVFLITPLVLHFYADKKEIANIIGMLISKFIPFFIVLFIHLKKQSEFLKKFKKNYVCIFLFPISTVFIVTLQHVVFFEYPVQSKVTSYAVLIANSFLILANIVVFDFIDLLYQNTLAESEIAAANELINIQRLRYQELLDHNRDIIKLQHDSRNFYMGLISELRDGKTELAIKHLCSVLRDYDNNKIMGKTIVDSLVDSKRCASLKKNIDIIFEVGNLGEIIIPATDLAIMFGNALDNAIEECERIVDKSKKDISVFITMKSNNVIIIIKNPTSRDIDIKNLSTVKSKSENHGFGVAAMKRVAEKYSGDVLFAYDKRVFTTAIIFNNSMNIRK